MSRRLPCTVYEGEEAEEYLKKRQRIETKEQDRALQAYGKLLTLMETRHDLMYEKTASH